jgi:hypothetical protein
MNIIIQNWDKTFRVHESDCQGFRGVQVKQRTYFPLVSAMEMAIWQAILT